MLLLRIRQLICDGHPDFVVSEDSFPMFLYPYATYDPDNVEKGLFKSAILVKVCYQLSNIFWPVHLNHQCFKFLFTSPSSAQDIDTEKDLDEPSFRPSKSRKRRAPTRGHVANIMGLKTVTPRSIVYVCVQVCSSLVYSLMILILSFVAPVFLDKC